MIKLKCVKNLEDNGLTIGNYMIYSLLVDDVIVSNYYVNFFRRISGAKMFYKAEIEYENLFSCNQNSEYVNKGYTKQGLELLCKELFRNNLTPYIYLSINKNNEISKHVALSTGFKQVDDETFCIYHPDAINLYKEAIRILNEMGNEAQYKSEIDDFESMVNGGIKSEKSR